MLGLRRLGDPMDDLAAAIHAFDLHSRGMDSPVTTLDAQDAGILY